MIKDPICGMEVENQEIACKFEGRKYFFCSKGCLQRFKDSPREFSEKYIYDLVIIGAGPAGLTAAVYASVLKIDTFLLTKDIGGQAIDSTKIKNYMGFDFISGKELAKKFEHQFLHEHYLEHKIDEVIRIERSVKGYEILTKSKNRIAARVIIIATGMKRRNLDIPGGERLLRRGVSYDFVHDAALFKGRDVVVIGGGNSAIQAAGELNKAGCRAILVSKGRLVADESGIDELKKSGKVAIMENSQVIEILGKEHVEGVIVESLDNLGKKHVSCSGVFIQIGFLPNTEFCQGILKLNSKGEIMIKPDCSTGVDGIFASGDVTDCFGKRIVIASGEGAKATLSAKSYLLSKRS